MSTITNVTITALHTDETVNFECAELSIVQTFTPEWSEETAYGKMDPISTYSRTSRTAAFTFIVLGKTLKEAIPLQRSVDTFIKMNYPTYGGTSTGAFINSPPFFKINMIQDKAYKEMKGYINGAIEIVPGSQKKAVPLVSPDGFFVERRYDISFSLTVLHSGIVGFGGSGDFADGSGFVFHLAPELEEKQSTVQKVAAAFGLSGKDGIGAILGVYKDKKKETA